MKILDVGHRYELLCLDGNKKQILQFVKRHDTKKPWRFPGNNNSYPGTTMQDVLHCLCNRIRYLESQIPCTENEAILHNLQQCLFLLEQRAARRHGLELPNVKIEWFELKKLCPKCGHTVCDHRENKQWS